MAVRGCEEMDEIDAAWGQLATLDPESREVVMRTHYAALAVLPEAERRRQLRAMARAEYALPYGQLRALTVSQLLAWLHLEPSVAHRVTASYNAVIAELPDDILRRRADAVKDVTDDLPAIDAHRLQMLVPTLFHAS